MGAGAAFFAGMADFRRKSELARLLHTLWASVSQEGSGARQ
jgi:hypothetical protein